jgi:ribosomal 30S subunit maturation factor RimM
MPEYLHVATVGKAHGIRGAVSVLSKTAPESLIFKFPLYIKIKDTIQYFTVSSFEEYHIKIVCTSPLIPDRTTAEIMNGSKLYCNKADFFQAHPEQVYDTLCEGFAVLDSQNKLLGHIEYIHFIHDIPMIKIKTVSQSLSLPLKLDSIDHENSRITLSYMPHGEDL